MRFLFVLLAILAGIVLLLKIETGELDAQQVTGIAIILLGLAIVSPPTWPSGWFAN